MGSVYAEFSILPVKYVKGVRYVINSSASHCVQLLLSQSRNLEFQRWIFNIRRESVCSPKLHSTDLIEPPTPAAHRCLTSGAVLVLFQWNNYTLPASQPGVWQRSDQSDQIQTQPKIRISLWVQKITTAALPLRLDSKVAQTKEEMVISIWFSLVQFAASNKNILHKLKCLKLHFMNTDNRIYIYIIGKCVYTLSKGSYSLPSFMCQLIITYICDV